MVRDFNNETSKKLEKTKKWAYSIINRHLNKYKKDKLMFAVSLGLSIGMIISIIMGEINKLLIIPFAIGIIITIPAIYLTIELTKRVNEYKKMIDETNDVEIIDKWCITNV